MKKVSRRSVYQLVNQIVDVRPAEKDLFGLIAIVRLRTAPQLNTPEMLVEPATGILL